MNVGRVQRAGEQQSNAIRGRKRPGFLPLDLNSAASRVLGSDSCGVMCRPSYRHCRWEVAGTARERRKATLASNVTRHHGPDPWAAWESLASTKYSRVCRAVRASCRALLCLSLCFPLASQSLSPPVHHVSLRGVAPVSESAVRCSVYLKGSPWSAPPIAVLPTWPHTLECICAGLCLPHQ